MSTKVSSNSLVTVTCFVLFVCSAADAHRILGVFPLAMPSHYFLGNSLLKGLAEAGHDVTIVTVFHEKNPPKNGTYREIFLDGVYESQRGSEIFNSVLSVKKTQTNFIPFLWTYKMNTLGYFVCEETLKHPKTQRLIKSNEKFDIVITSQFLMESLKGLAPHFHAHQVIFNNVMANSWMHHLVGNPSLPSFHPEIMLGLPAKMSFAQRMHNAVFKLVQTLNHHLFYYPIHDELVRKYISEEVSLYDVLYNVSLVLSNSHPSLTVVQPAVPVVKEIGGFHVSEPKALPEDLRGYLDAAEDGAILFSLGSYLKSEDLSASTRAAILGAFARRKERVIWKWDDEVLPGQPPNVKLAKWLPQADILAHPNIKLFITHGGYLSRTETVYHGVPVIALPILGDQRMNAKTAEDDGYGIALDISTLTEDALLKAIEEIISNSKYTENAKMRSRIMRDRKQTPIEEAAYWIDYIVRYKGADHLKVPYLDLTWYQFYLLDVGLVISGFHVEPAKKLPEDLQKYLDDAKEGAILFSLGSNIKSADLSMSAREALLKAFAKRKERILMKWEDDVLPGKPSNVKISKWLPQSDILAHPNLKLFITHGGFLSTTETIYHGVPIIALPVFGDQEQNAMEAKNGGFAIVLSIHNLAEENLSAALEEVLSNSKYTENVMKRSRIFHDRKQPPLEEAIYWVEYIVRHNGALHWRVSHVQMPWYQYILLDVFAFYFGVLFISFIVLKFVCKQTIGRLMRKDKLKKQ